MARYCSGRHPHISCEHDLLGPSSFYLVGKAALHISRLTHPPWNLRTELLTLLCMCHRTSSTHYSLVLSNQHLSAFSVRWKGSPLSPRDSLRRGRRLHFMGLIVGNGFHFPRVGYGDRGAEDPQPVTSRGK